MSRPKSENDQSSNSAKPLKGSLLVYENLREGILNLSLEPGSLLDEQALAAEFGMSRSPVREALIRLSSTGLITTLPNRSAVVAPLDFRQIPAFLEALVLAYVATARRAALHRQPGDAESLRAIEERRESLRKKGSNQDRIDINSEFHLAVANIGRSDYLMWFLERLLDHAQRLIYASTYFEPDQSRQKAKSPHQQIITAIENGDPDAAEAAGRLDAEYLRTQVLREFSIATESSIKGR